jgi:hypothetical protein
MAAIDSGWTQTVTPDDVAHYRTVLDDHRLSLSNGLCIACGVLRCAPWVDAFEQLVMAGKLVVIPHQWLMRADRSGR